ncbi:hypothetical protein [Desulforamulus reducens]|nr:hypothetical protein [Desulforamulus reducens]
MMAVRFFCSGIGNIIDTRADPGDGLSGLEDLRSVVGWLWLRLVSI